MEIKLKKHELKCNCSSLGGGGWRVFTRNILAVWLGQLSVWGNIANLFTLHMDKWWYISVLRIEHAFRVQKCLVLRKLPSLEWKAAAIFSSVLQHCTGEHRMMLFPQLISWMTLLIYYVRTDDKLVPPEEQRDSFTLFWKKSARLCSGAV